MTEVISRYPQRTFRSWGGGQGASAILAQVVDVEELSEVIHYAHHNGRRIALRGSGNSYGDAALGNDIVVDISVLTDFFDWSEEQQILDIGSGVTISDIWRFALPQGYWPHVVPGTMFPTVGGALGHNIHGKNAWKVGTFGEFVQSFEMVTATGETKLINRDSSPELFHAVIGSAGLLGVITRIQLGLRKVATGWVDVEPVAVRHFDDLFECFEDRLDTADYLVGWLDGFATGAALGRGLVHAANYVQHDESASSGLTIADQELPTRLFGVIPKSLMWMGLWPFNHRTGMRFVNAAKYWMGVREHHLGVYRQSLVAFSFLLDYVPGWKRAYGQQGLLQWQCFVPKEEAPAVFRQIFERLQAAQLESFLAVFKRHRRDPFLISHGVDGYSLALDFPARWLGQLRPILKQLEDLVLTAQGRFYLAKDSMMEPECFARYIGDDALHRLASLRDEFDPNRVFQTQMSHRLGLEDRS